MCRMVQEVIVREAIYIVKKLVIEDLPEQDNGQVMIPLNVDENLRNEGRRQCLKALERSAGAAK